MPSLSFNTALTEIERAIHRAIRWKLLKLAATVADIDALRAYATMGASESATAPYTAVFVTAEGVRYEWSRASTATDNGASVIRPTDVSASQPGRWLVTTSTATTGYLVAVNYWQGETRKKEFQQRILAVRPSVAILWESSDNDPRSTIPGAIYDYPCRFSIWAVDENLRPDYEALFGSDYSYDSGHPGAIQIVGDVKKLLADENKRRVDENLPNGGPLGLNGGAKLIQIGGEDVEDADLAEKVMVLSLGITVIGSVENPDAASEYVAVDELWAQPKTTALNDQDEFDSDNYVVSGCAFAIGASLTTSPTAGSAVIAGAAVTLTVAAHTFGANADTYCDLKPNGAMVYVPVALDFPEPDVTATALRVGVVRTDDMGIVDWRYIAATSRNYPDAYRAIPEPDLA